MQDAFEFRAVATAVARSNATTAAAAADRSNESCAYQLWLLFLTAITTFSQRFRFMFDYSDYYCHVDVTKAFLRMSNDVKRLFASYKPPLNFAKRFLTFSSNKFSSSRRVLSYRQSLSRSTLVI